MRKTADSSEIWLAPSVAAMNDFMEPHRQWIEKALGCPFSESVTCELEVPFGQIVAADLLKGAALAIFFKIPRLQTAGRTGACPIFGGPRR